MNGVGANYLVCFGIVEDVHGRVHPGARHLLQLPKAQQRGCIACTHNLDVVIRELH